MPYNNSYLKLIADFFFDLCYAPSQGNNISYPKFNNLDVLWDFSANCGKCYHIVSVLHSLGITLFSCAPPIDFFIMSQSKIFEISVDALTAVNQINRMVRLL
jgi:hypothetical protein